MTFEKRETSTVSMRLIERIADMIIKNNKINPEDYSRYNVKRGLRNEDGSGVLVGLTEIGSVHGYIMDEGEKVPVKGRLHYRGIDVAKMVEGFQKEKRFGYEESSFLLLFGELPTERELDEYNILLAENRKLPEGFTEDVILKAASKDIMNILARCVLSIYSYDYNPDELSIDNMIRQCITLVACLPTIIAYGFQAKKHYYDGDSLYIHSPQPGLSTAENFLYMIRPDSLYTKLEAELLDLALVLHAEHGGGNNSSFTTHVVSSSGTDTYSAIAAAIGSLKGPKHGGASLKVMDMMKNIKENVQDWENEEEVAAYLKRMINKEVFDKSGLVYGMGHAVYTASDPRAVLLKEKAKELANEKDMMKEFILYKNIEKLTPKVFAEEKGITKTLCANVDLYSGFVYSMLNISKDLYVPIFAMARVTGWCAHRIEEILNGSKIIRPAYKSVAGKSKYKKLSDRR
jgi:citrate synthase